MLESKNFLLDCGFGKSSWGRDGFDYFDGFVLRVLGKFRHGDRSCGMVQLIMEFQCRVSSVGY